MERQFEVDLANVVLDLPPAQIHQVIDFANYLRSPQSLAGKPRRGSAKALLAAREQVGPLQFAPGELEARLVEI